MTHPVILASSSLAATKIVAEATSQWNGLKPRWLQVAEFRKLINANAVLGYSPLMALAKYATTPIISALGDCDDYGAVSVSFVGPSLGKTTAANYFLRKNKEQLRGLAFCRTEVGIPYVTSMLRLLGLNPLNPPNGWLSCLLEALNGDPKDNRESVLILDEFVCAADDFEVESALIMSIKAEIRRSRTRVIILTPSEALANFLLSKNNLKGIVPLTGTYGPPMYPNGNWSRMSWPVDTMKVAARQLSFLSDKTSHEIDDVIDQHYQGLTNEEKESIALTDIQKVLEGALAAPASLLESKRVDTQRSNDLDEYDPGCSMEKCCIS